MQNKSKNLFSWRLCLYTEYYNLFLYKKYINDPGGNVWSMYPPPTNDKYLSTGKHSNINKPLVQFYMFHGYPYVEQIGRLKSTFHRA